MSWRWVGATCGTPAFWYTAGREKPLEWRTQAPCRPERCLFCGPRCRFPFTLLDTTSIVGHSLTPCFLLEAPAFVRVDVIRFMQLYSYRMFQSPPLSQSPDEALVGEGTALGGLGSSLSTHPGNMQGVLGYGAELVVPAVPWAAAAARSHRTAKPRLQLPDIFGLGSSAISGSISGGKAALSQDSARQLNAPQINQPSQLGQNHKSGVDAASRGRSSRKAQVPRCTISGLLPAVYY